MYLIKKIFNIIKNYFKYRNRKINMLQVDRLKELKDLIDQLKRDISVHQNTDPNNPDNFENGQLYGVLDAANNIIDKIAQKNGVTL